MKYKYLWQLLCVDGSWQGLRRGGGSLRKSSATPTLKSAWLELSWAELSWLAHHSFHFVLFAFFFLLLSCHVSELGLNLSSVQLNSTPDSARLISFLVILDDVWHTFLLHKTAILQRILSRPDCLFKAGRVSVRLGSNETKPKLKEAG